MAWPNEIDEVVGMQISFSDAEYGAKRRQTRRDRFLARIEAATPWALLVSVIEPHYPKGGGRAQPDPKFPAPIRSRRRRGNPAALPGPEQERRFVIN